MDKRLPLALFATTAIILLGCSNPPSTPEPLLLVTVPPPDVSMDLPLEPDPRREEFKGEFCQLGRSCMALDPRPFEACLLGATHCVDKATEPLLIGEPPVEVHPPPGHPQD